MLDLGAKSSLLFLSPNTMHTLWTARREMYFLGCITDSSLQQAKHIDPICAGVPCYLTKGTQMYWRGILSIRG